MNIEDYLKGQTDEKLNFDGWIYTHRGSRYVYRISKFVILTFFNAYSHPANCTRILSSEVGIYKRKQENKKTRFRPRKQSRKKERKHALDQESDQEKRKLSSFFFLLSCFLFLVIACRNHRYKYEYKYEN